MKNAQNLIVLLFFYTFQAISFTNS